jgi:UDP-glucose 4-epimerase
MKVLITGGAGFIGSHLADLLISRHHEVVVVDNLSLGKKEHIQHLEDHIKFLFIKEDLLHFHKIKNIFGAHHFDVVFHLASNSDIFYSANHPRKDLRNTFTASWNVLECCRLHGVKQLVFSSTSAIYGEKTEKLREDSGPCHPVSYYGAAKLAAESFISAYSWMNHMQSWIFRFPNVVGPRATHGILYDFIKKLKINPRELEILGDGRQKKPYVYVADIVNAMLFVFRRSKEILNIYNIGTQDRISATDIAKIVCEEMGLKNVNFLYSGGRCGWPGDVPRYQYDLRKIHALGWKARYSSSQAVRVAVRSMLRK